jgi:hypothetical protein
MAREITLPPSASSLSESMRDLGYSLATAVADIIDNSITAEATEVDIFCDLTSGKPTLVIIDNGTGMTEEKLLLAMKHGSVNPKQAREPNDLGRFGLGLKTASFSQCRNLTVISSINSEMCGAEWDLDHISERDEWCLSILDDEDIQKVAYFNQIGKTGTAVVWTKLDRLFEDQYGNKRDEIVFEKLDLVDRHLSLVFHRFLAGEVNHHPKLSIRINGHPVKPFDPFCRKIKATQVLPEEIVRVDGKNVVIQPYILPHHSKLTAEEYDFYEDRSSFVSNQGVYIYRNGRLMAWGDWFRLVPKGEATKLARVQIDFPNALDESWTIDIKKSRARPPHEVKERLRQIISKVTSTSTRIHRGRGQKLYQDAIEPVWERYADKGNVRFDLNKSHPLLISLEKKMTKDQSKCMRAYLTAVTASLPIEMIYSDYSTAPRSINQSEDLDEKTALEKVSAISEVLFEGKDFDPDALKKVIFSIPMFQVYRNSIEHFITGKLNEKK